MNLFKSKPDGFRSGLSTTFSAELVRAGPLSNPPGLLGTTAGSCGGSLITL
ncbi:hypothetical protein [Burkholderia sp. NLJ2]|uniref:hypothetical protein n=1 Tax=Burkholderia sp. NLJ2 TaxID=3090699 RepID=UPI003C6CBCEB